MTDAMVNVMASARSVSNISEFGYDDGISVMGAFLKKDGAVSVKRTLKAGQTYAFLGGGDSKVTDLDIHVLGPDGSELESDEDTDATPVVVFKAPKEGTYTLRLTHFDGTGAGFCALAILREGGYDVPVGNLSTAAAKCIVACEAVDDNADEKVTFHAQTNTWAVFGGVLPKDRWLQLTMGMDAKRHVVVVAGDNNAKDVDSFMLNSSDSVVSKDEDDDPIPILDYRTESARYGVRFKNIDSSGPSLILAAVLDLD